MKHICLQENDYDCGLACIKMMLAHYHKNKKLLNLDKEIVNARYSLYQLKLYAEKYNLLTEGIEFEKKDKLFSFENSLIEICIKNKNHFTIFEKKKGKYVYLVDPTIGRIKLKEDEFFEIFTGYALIKKEVIPLDKIKEFRVSNNLNFIIIYITFLVLDFGLLTLMSYLQNDSKYLFHQFLIILALVLLLLSKISLINRHINSIDNTIKNILNSSKKLSSSTKKGLLYYKVYLIKNVYGRINNIFICAFIALILLVNNLISLPIMILLALFAYVITKNSIISNNTITFKLNIIEKEFLEEGRNEVYDTLISTSKSIQNNKSMVVVINQLIIMMIVTILNNLSEVNSFQFVLFHLFYYYMFLNKVTGFFKDDMINNLQFRKYASTFNYLKKQSDKESIIENNDKIEKK